MLQRLRLCRASDTVFRREIDSQRQWGYGTCYGDCFPAAKECTGKYTGLQARIHQLNEFAIYVPCAGHSLNLVGVKAAECCLQTVTFFDFVQHLYTFLLVLLIAGMFCHQL